MREGATGWTERRARRARRSGERAPPSRLKLRAADIGGNPRSEAGSEGRRELRRPGPFTARAGYFFAAGGAIASQCVQSASMKRLPVASSEAKTITGTSRK